MVESIFEGGVLLDRLGEVIMLDSSFGPGRSSSR